MGQKALNRASLVSESEPVEASKPDEGRRRASLERLVCMRIFSRFRKEPRPDLEAVKALQERVREMRKRIQHGEVELTELFAMIREDERPIMREVEARPAEQVRVHPDQVPSRAASA